MITNACVANTADQDKDDEDHDSCSADDACVAAFSGSHTAADDNNVRTSNKY